MSKISKIFCSEEKFKYNTEILGFKLKEVSIVLHKIDNEDSQKDENFLGKTREFYLIVKSPFRSI